MSRSSEDEGSYTLQPEDLDVDDATVAACPDAGYARADLTSFCRLDELGLRATGQRLEPRRAVLACDVVEPDGSDGRWCRRCGCEGRVRDTVVRTLAQEPLGWRPTTLKIRVRRFRCTACGKVTEPRGVVGFEVILAAYVPLPTSPTS